MITILDYGEGNIASVQKAFESLNVTVKLSNDPKDIKSATHLIVPGQGAFNQVMTQLSSKNLIKPLTEYIKSGKKFLGICLGFQILFESSLEFGTHKGLGIFPGSLKKIETPNLKVPHMGWNQCNIQNDSQMFSNISNNTHVYFVHSYYLTATTPNIVASTTVYGEEFISSIQHNNIWATQFHPEKSGDIGIQLLRNFLK